MRRPAWPSLGFSLLRRSSSRRRSRPRWSRRRWPPWASAVAGAWAVDEGWPARATMGQSFVPCSAMCRCASAGCSSAPCQGPGEARSFAALDLGQDAVAPELAYVTARYAALVPFGKVATLLSELLPMGGAQNAGTVRNRTLRVGEKVVQQHSTEPLRRPTAQAAGPVMVGLDGGYVRSRHRPERHFEVVAGKVIDARGAQHRFAFARNGPGDRVRGLQAGACHGR